ncbi:MAG: hypothetical protein V4619_00155 [Bacteroidota bacterium]
MKFKIYLLVISLFGTISLKSIAQVSFNKRALGVVGNTPKAGDFSTGASLENVDMTTGTLKIGIPLYEIKVNDISVPISLNYSATGLKVGQEAGTPGMGWDLSAGGKIITNVQGKPDLATNGMYSKYFAGDSIPSTINNAFLKTIVNDDRDNAWDTYTYILPNKGGSYVSDYVHDGLTIPYDPLVRVQHKVVSPEHTIYTDGLIYSFVNGDARQNVKMPSYITSSGQVTPTGTEQAATTWYDYDLYSIKSLRHKDVVNFKYDSFSSSAVLAPKTRTNISESLPLYREVTQSSFAPQGWLFADNNHDDEKYEVREPFISKSETRYVNHNRLKEIDFPTGKVTFDYTPDDLLGRDRLSNIKIFKKEGTSVIQIKRYAFYYNESYLSYGHYLDSMTVFDSKNVRQGVWKFAYKDGPLPLAPNVLTKAQDRWGFFNNQTGNKTLLEDLTKCFAWNAFTHYPIEGTDIKYTRDENHAYYASSYPYSFPNMNTNPDYWRIGEKYYSVPFANREFNFNSAIKGTLNKIVTPLGATYDYEYEPHVFEAPIFNDETARVGGGIRIKSITKSIGHSTLYYGQSTIESIVKKTYQYGNANEADPIQTTKERNGRGTIIMPANIVSNESVYYDQRDGAHNQRYKRIDNFILLSHPINNLIINNGSFVMYKCVTEYLQQNAGAYAFADTVGHTNKTHGKTVYYNNPPLFDVYPYGYPGESPSWGMNFDYSYSNYIDYPLVNKKYFSIETGASAETGAGTYAIHKYEFMDSINAYRMAERVKYKYKFYKNPENTHWFRNIYASLSGQIVGPIPEQNGIPGPPRVYSDPDDKRGLSTINPEGFVSLTIGGSMNYFTASYLINENNSPDYEGKYAFTPLKVKDLSYCMRLVEETRQEGTVTGLPGSELHTKYTYDNKFHMLPTTILTHPREKEDFNEDYTDIIKWISEYTEKKIYYPQDIHLLGSSLSVSGYVATRQALDEPLAEFTTQQREGTVADPLLIALTLNTFKDDNGAIVPSKSWKLAAPENYIAGYLPPISQTWEGTTPDATMFKEQISYDVYTKGQLHQYTELGKKTTAVLWGYNNQYPVAKVVNAGGVAGFSHTGYANASVAYTSFEMRDTCNWLYIVDSIRTDTTSISGKKVYNLAAGAITKVNATESGNYVLAYWYKYGANVNVAGGTIGAEVIKNKLGPWTYAERQVSAVSGTLTVSGTGLIDELRFHPKDAQMTTYTYEPLIGISCTIDANGRPQYFKYDDSQRLKEIRDWQGNIIKAYKYITGSAN